MELREGTIVSKSLEQKVKESQALTRFGHCLFELRSDRGQSLRDVAKVLDISANYLSELERGVKKPSSTMIKALSTYYGINHMRLYALLEIPAQALASIFETRPHAIERLNALVQRASKLETIPFDRGTVFVDEMINFIDRFITELESE